MKGEILVGGVITKDKFTDSLQPIEIQKIRWRLQRRAQSDE